MLSRLVYRKGIDLLAKLIPIICDLYPEAEFLIGGDGPKRAMLNEVVRSNKLQDRVQLLGTVKADQVRNILIKGDIFLNSSLTEAFCIAIVEAVSCGLQVVSTNVGGIPEVLPPDLIWLGEPTVNGLVGALRRAIWDREQGNIVCPLEAHNRIRQYYQWPDIAERTELIYDSLIDDLDPNDLQAKSNRNLNSKLRSQAECRLSDSVNDENDPNQLNTTNGLNTDRRTGHLNGLSNGHLNNHLNGLNGIHKHTFLNGLSRGEQVVKPRTNRVNNTAEKVLYENQPQLIDLDYLRENQDKTGPLPLLRQCYNSSWFFGTFLLLLLFVEYVMRLFYDFWSPTSQIDLCPSTASPNATDRRQQTKIRSTKEVNNKFSVLKVNRHQFTKSCTNCKLYVQQPVLSPPVLLSLENCSNSREAGGHLATSELASRIRQYSLCDLANNHSSSSNHSFNLANYMHSLDLTESTNPAVNLVASTTGDSNQCGLKEIHELMNHQTDVESIVCEARPDSVEHHQQDDCSSSDSADSQRASASQTSDRRREQPVIYQCQHTIAPCECNLETNATDDEAMSQESIESVDKQTDDDEKRSTTESTSGYNTSNSMDSDNGSDSNSDSQSESNSTGATNLDDLADLCSNYDCRSLVDQLVDQRLSSEANQSNGHSKPQNNQKRRRKSISSTHDKELNAELNDYSDFNQLNDQLTSLLVLNDAASEAKDLFYKSNLNLNNNSPTAECYAYRCDGCLRVRRRRSAILIKN